MQAEIDSAIAQAKIDSANTTLWRGEKKCVSLFKSFTRFVKVQKISESSLSIELASVHNKFASFTASKKANGKYFGTTEGCGLKPDRFNFNIDFINLYHQLYFVYHHYILNFRQHNFYLNYIFAM